MKLQNVFPLILAGSFLVACGDATTDDTDLPPDAEDGLETLDGKDDSFAIRPGSPEADAVVEYVNRPIADNAAGIVFRDQIDAKLHRIAARNIAAYRAGDDGSFGTADDRLFEDLAALDGVKYVGRTALMQLFELADAAGHFQRASVDCADFVDHDRWNNYSIDSYADLLEYENSRCTQINGNVTIQINGTDLLPPAARAIRNLRHLRTIHGNVRIIGSTHFTSIHFENLETITGTLTAESNAGRQHTLEFGKLTSAKSIYMSQIEEPLFPALKQNPKIELFDSGLEGFTALESADRLTIDQRAEGTFPVAFDALVEVTGELRIRAHRPNSWIRGEVAFTGGFSKLAKAATITLMEGKYDAFAFPRLADADSLYMSQTSDVYQGMTKLERVGELTSHNDLFASNIHSGPPVLKTVGSLNITTTLPVSGYDKLETAEADINITTQQSVDGFDALSVVGRNVNINLAQNRNPATLEGFNKVSYLEALTITANNAPVTLGSLFEALEETGDGIYLASNRGFDRNPVFRSLAAMGGTLRVDRLHEGVDMMPLLEIVDGNILIYNTPMELTGFPNLEHIEGNLELRASLTTMTGMGNLTSIGGDLSVPRSFTGAQLDAFLNRLTEFSGAIRYN